MMDVKDFIMNIFIIRWSGISLYRNNAENAEIGISYCEYYRSILLNFEED